MENIVWQSFKLGDLFKRKTPPNTGKPAKALTIYEENDGSRIALVTRGEKNNGVVGYIDKIGFPTSKNKIIYNDQFGTILFHNYEFTTIKDHLSILEPSDRLSKILEQNINAYVFITKLINKIFNKQIFGFNYSAADYKFPREIIMLPTIEIKDKKSSIWEKNGKYWTLAVEYIEILMNKAKEQKDAKTIKVFEANKEKYEAEKSKYESGYLKELPNLIWKSFKLADLFITITGRDSRIAQKNLDKALLIDDKHTVSIVTESTQNNGVGFFMKEDDPILKGKIVDRGLTFGTQFGNCHYHDYTHFIIGNTNYLRPINNKLQEIMNIYVGSYFASLITYIFKKSGLYGFGNKIDQSAFYREIILLPVIEVQNEQSCIWKDNGKYWTLAFYTVCHIYLQGQIIMLENKIKNYTHWY